MSALRMLHVEDERNTRLMVKDLLGGAPVTLVQVGSAEEGLATLEREAFDLTLLDWTLPGLDGGRFLEAVRDHGRAGRVVVLTAVGTLERAREAMRAGAYDFMVKPVDPDALLDLVDKAARSVALLDQAGRAGPAVAQAPAGVVGRRLAGPAGEAIIGHSPEVRDLRARLELVATSDASVLIVGESGTGKELVARALHEASGRHRGRLVVVNCAAVPDTLFEAELFGHRKGAFTGASADRPGLVELAHQGTLFLDEVGELAPVSQAKLLRVLQERRVRRVGDTKDQPVDLRVIAATNRDLEQEVDRGAFRQDLLYRLDVVRIEVPPLRERKADLPELLDHFLRLHAAAYDRPAPAIDDATLRELLAFDWPGNIRELENAAKRLVLLGPVAGLAELRRRRGHASGPVAAVTPSPRPADGAVRPLDDVVREATRGAILAALAAVGGSRTNAAQLLGVSRKTLFNKMRELGIQEETHWS
ncbi:MAG: sigma-54-dependent Fis family transcriptional regulator [Planctomycetes bacterium]|nr:sigma-54-dependent Fis family transcriptional regulator [Planctomycetota bacterium]